MGTKPIRLSSSLRDSDAQATYKSVRGLAEHAGVVRVSEITRLDVIGIPVYESIRRDSMPGSTNVHAGKGVLSIEAKVGAYMEALEFSAVEFRSKVDSILHTTPRALGEQDAPWRFLDLCPVIGHAVSPDKSIAAVPANDLATGREVLVPAELVYVPFRQMQHGQLPFGSSSNGLASGNSREEALLHGLCEVVERDIISFNRVRDTSQLVEEASLQGMAADLNQQIRRAGLRIDLHLGTNQFRIPFFEALLVDENSTALRTSIGFGAHVLREVAAVRAITEAAQGRLGLIHGLRTANPGGAVSREQSQLTRTPDCKQGSGGRQTVSYASVQDLVSQEFSITSATRAVVLALAMTGLSQVLWVDLTPPNWPISVVRVLVPGLENFGSDLARVGPRLGEHMRQKAVGT